MTTAGRDDATAPGYGEGSGALAHIRPSWSSNPVAGWLVEHRGQRFDLARLLEAPCLQLVEQGVPLDRVNLSVSSRHPEVAARTAAWRRGESGIAFFDMSYGTRSAPAYLNSPAKLIHDGAGAIRRRLEGPSPLLDFPVLHDLVEMDCTDYVIMPILHSTGEINFISWATCKSGGFSTAQLTLLYDLLPLISLRVEVETAHEETRTPLNTYLGREPARRVLGGSVRRAQVESLSAAIWISDIRGFTQLSDRMPARVVIALLDDYFDIQAAAVKSAGGEILKFMGDGLLAIFADGPSLVEDSRRALTAARRALRRLASENDERTGEGQPEIRCGIGLHAGEVRYGNIGARERLDFMVIGPAVNEAARVEALCKVLDRPLLASAAFAEAHEADGLVSLGFHGLRGVREPKEIFALRGPSRPEGHQTG